MSTIATSVTYRRRTVSGVYASGYSMSSTSGALPKQSAIVKTCRQVKAVIMTRYFTCYQLMRLRSASLLDSVKFDLTSVQPNQRTACSEGCPGAKAQQRAWVG